MQSRIPSEARQWSRGQFLGLSWRTRLRNTKKSACRPGVHRSRPRTATTGCFESALNGPILKGNSSSWRKRCAWIDWSFSRRCLPCPRAAGVRGCRERHRGSPEGGRLVETGGGSIAETGRGESFEFPTSPSSCSREVGRRASSAWCSRSYEDPGHLCRPHHFTRWA